MYQSYLVTCNDCPYGRWLNLGLSKGKWLHVWAWVNGGYSSDGQIHYWELTDSGVVQRINDNNVSVLYDGGLYEKVDINGYARTGANTYPMFDDIYIATGDQARARVEVGNASIYNSSTNLTILTPTSWGDNSITATVRQGSFTDGESAYLYIVDANGVVNTTGYPITFGDTASNNPPVLTGIGNKTIHEQETLTFNVLASDDDPGDTLTLSASNLPTGATFTDNGGGSGIFSWTPTDQQANTYPNIHFEVTDGTDTDTEDIIITVLDGVADCTPAWNCSDWSVCADSLQTRSCHDDNQCGTDAGRPVETAGCDSTAPGMVTNLTAT
jgi:hypothetical protein